MTHKVLSGSKISSSRLTVHYFTIIDTSQTLPAPFIRHFLPVFLQFSTYTSSGTEPLGISGIRAASFNYFRNQLIDANNRLIIAALRESMTFILPNQQDQSTDLSQQKSPNFFICHRTSKGYDAAPCMLAYQHDHTSSQNMQLTYNRMLLDGLVCAVHSPFVAIIFVWFLRAVAIAEQLKIKQINKLHLHTCNPYPSAQEIM